MKVAIAVCFVLVAASCGRDEPVAFRPPGEQRRAPAGDDQGRRQVAAPSLPPGTPRIPRLVTEQILYVPVYSHVYWGEQAKPFNLACTLSIRNTDPTRQITLNVVDYYDTTGALVGHYLDQDITLAPLETTEYYVAERDVVGGSGANFIVKWSSPAPANPPVVEALMIGNPSGQGISFVSRAREILE